MATANADEATSLLPQHTHPSTDPPNDINNDNLDTDIIDESTSLKQTNFSAGIQIICVIAGTGLLQIPYALSQAGWLGILILCCAAVTNCYTGSLISSLMYMHDPPLNGYAAVGHAAYGVVGEYCVHVFYYCALVGTACLYVILAGMNMCLLVGCWDERVWMVIVGAVLLIPHISLRTLKEVGITSLIGAITSAAMVVLVFALSLADFNKYENVVRHDLLNYGSFGSVLATFCFSYGGNYVYPQVQASMKTPVAFKRVLIWSTLAITCMYLVVGIAAYRTYGHLALSPITLNMSAGLWRTICTICITVHVVLACPILLTTFALDTESVLGIDKLPPAKQLAQVALQRISIITSVVLISTTIPYFAHVMTLIGAVANTLLIFVFPIVFNAKLVKQGVWGLGLGCVVVSVGLVGGSLGTADAVSALYRDMLSQ